MRMREELLMNSDREQNDTTSSSGFFRSGKLRDRAKPKIGTDCEPTLTRPDDKPTILCTDRSAIELRQPVPDPVQTPALAPDAENEDSEYIYNFTKAFFMYPLNI
ncbi:hypothetical protein BpHYR1_036568 [Brachionus plicatilis]|uniref:Uncharacterized protein n=1 Tax=Brachionus plicatilis TaxID=10195 RepID=A0A3M7PWJ8_BRAPC|nr:hypothetical protein BpHYR1_036568 [Brachionus plicatilis]